MDMDVEIAETLPALPARSMYAPKFIPIEVLIEYADRGLLHEEIAQLIGTSRPNVTQRLQAYGYTKERIEHWATHRGRVLQLMQSQIISNITPAKLGKASLRDSVVALGILQDKELDLTQGRVSGPQIQVIQQQSMQAGRDMALVEREIALLQAEIAKLMPQVIDITEDTSV